MIKQINTIEYNYKLLLYAWQHEKLVRRMVRNDLQIMRELAGKMTERPEDYRNLFYVLAPYYKYLTKKSLKQKQT